jgi:hypothetical protein
MTLQEFTASYDAMSSEDVKAKVIKAFQEILKKFEEMTPHNVKCTVHEYDFFMTFEEMEDKNMFGENGLQI